MSSTETTLTFDEVLDMLKDEAPEEDPNDFYIQHLENQGYWEARADEERYF